MKGRFGGSIYSRPGSSMLWLKYYDAQGRPHRESTGTTNETEAKRMLAVRMGAIAKGAPVAIKANIRIGELLDDLKRDYTVNGKVWAAIEPNVDRLRQAFGRWRACDLTTADLRAYIA